MHSDFADGRVRTVHSSPSSDVYITTRISDGLQLVVKRTKITGPNDMKRFDKELELLQACEHASVLRPVGVLRVPPTYALVLPVYSGGSLFATLHASGRTLTLRAKLSLSCELAGAIAHLHERGVLHRDVKSDNVLLDGHGRVVLADFNAAEWESLVTSDIVMQARPTGGFFKQFVVGTLPYMAPELLRSVRGAAYSRACDVYSLAITFNEVLTQTVPYSDALMDQVALHTILEARYNHDALTTAIASEGLRPAQPDVESIAGEGSGALGPVCMRWPSQLCQLSRPCLCCLHLLPASAACLCCCSPCSTRTRVRRPRHRALRSRRRWRSASDGRDGSARTLGVE